MTNDIKNPGIPKGINPATAPNPTTPKVGEGIAPKPGMPGGFGAGAPRPGTATPNLRTNPGTPSFGGEAAGKTTIGGTGASNAPKSPGDTSSNTELIMSIPVEVQVVLGSTTMPVATLMDLGRGAVITLDKQIGDPIDIVVNGRIIARGEVIVLEDDPSRFGVSLTEIIDK
ncbi:flagellar motor switch protein FliN/FliY [Bartonella sp. A1379B]|uniref:Flagellar motor switch protein FliN n=2 Tax=Bartonellaceae TaxID=772 RepID=E6YKZ9_9HYPH|nr:flagellar motor switch protein FliN/FliY [Bartonella sp. A1379B]AQX23141.1 flagellar motor switch protein FliN/FliY [Bartonella sp. 11B]AQX23560.1 flagellar motor switch protein FliN/FliY [Bartonella sp. 114]AQX25596.1 flagellar motor switch protein FliN/FliY [Bartonella sp. Coyote22sub2]KEC54245.1 flagellar motor switch protein FliN [Bartonella rochalimae ATCC BAA-1498]